MTPRIAAELAHLTRLSLTHPSWYEYARDKAQKLAAKDPLEMGELPLLLSNALRSKKHGPPRPSTQRRSD